MDNLNCKQISRTTAMRKAAVTKLASVAITYNATINIQSGTNYPRESRLQISLGSYRCSIDFDGNENLSAFLIHWYTDSNSDSTYPDGFAKAIRGSRNECHKRKATTCVDTFGELRQALGAGLAMLTGESK